MLGRDAEKTRGPVGRSLGAGVCDVLSCSGENSARWRVVNWFFIRSSSGFLRLRGH